LVYTNFDYPYDFGEEGEVVTTWQVADWLEESKNMHYHLKENFHKLYKSEIEGLFAQALTDALLDFSTFGKPIPTSKKKLFAGANAKIDEMFRKFLNERIVEGLGIDGVPTQSALEGKSKRLKKKTGIRRPSFIDTGQYRNSSYTYVK
jgi:hypothetical protein